MIAKRWLGLFAMVVMGAAPRMAQAALSETPSAFGNVDVKTTATLPGTISESTAATSHVIDLDLTASGCSVFDITPKALITVTDLAPASITSSFTPAARGAASCVVTMRDHTTLASLGTFTLTGTGVAPQIAVSPSSKAFGALRFNDAAPTHTASQVFTVSNNGDAGKNLTVNIAFATGQPGDYTITSGPSLPATIAPGSNALFTVTFNPAAAGPSATTMQVTSNDPLTSEVDVALSGTGTNAVIATTDVAFGTVNLPGSTALSASVTNTGAATRGPLTVTSAQINNGNGFFAFNGGGCSGTTCTFSPALSITNATALVGVICAPPTNAAAGMQTAQLVFTSDSDDNTDDTSTLTCTAARADLTINPAMITFPNQLLNTTSTATTVTISNPAGSTLNLVVSSITKAGTDPTQFTVGGTCAGGCTIAPGGSSTFTVSFAPTSLLTKSALIRIASNDPDNNPVDIAVQGIGVAPHASPSPSPINFTSTEVGATGTPATLTVTNTGSMDLTIASANLTSGSVDFTLVSGTTTGQTIVPSGTATWQIACKPLSVGAHAETFQILSNTDGTNGAALTVATNVTLNCQGDQGILTVLAPTSFNFGGVRAGDTAPPHTFVLKNTGNLSVTNITGVLSNTTVGYSISSPTFPITLAAGATQNVVVQFTPATGNDGGPVTLTFSGAWGAATTATMAVANIDGDGLSVGYDTSPASPAALDFGDVRFDQTKLMTYQVIDTDVSTIGVLSMTVNPVTAMTGEFTIVSYTHGASTFVCGATCPAVTLTGLNDKIIVTVRAAPASRVALLTANIVVHSDLATNSDRTVPLVANSTSATLTMTPQSNVVDFGAVDKDLAPPTQTIHLMNTGVAPLTVGAATKSGADLNRYAFSAAPAQTIAPGAGFDVMVTYIPMTERPANQFDVASITFPISGVFGTPIPTSVTVMVQGRGIDRHITTGPVPQFPNTFRNPGDKAPVLPVTITNTGEAPLNVSAVMLTNNPIWQLQNADPVTVPGFGSYAFKVSFVPTMAGMAPPGVLSITNNDNGMPMVTVTLQGMGINRNVEMGPSTIDLGFVGIGLPVKLSDIASSQLLHVASMDGANTFKIRSINIDGGNGAFTTIDSPVDVDLLPQATQQFDIQFAPMAQGDFEATATLFLDMDPLPQATVTLKGHALFADAQGGGGCSSGPGAGGGVVVVIGALLAARRRRLALLAAMAMALGSTAARADTTRNIELTVFHPTPSTIGSAFQLESPDVGANGDWAVAAIATYASNPFVLKTSLNEDAVIKERTTIALGGAYAFLDRYEAGARMPLYMQSGDTISSPTMYGITPASGTARGDLTLHGRIRLTPRGLLMLGIGLAVTLPTATSDQFAGVDKPQGRVLAQSAYTPNARLTILANFGAVVRARSQLANVDQGSGVAWGFGASLRVADQLTVNAEMFGELIPAGQRLDPTPSEPMGTATTLHTAEILGGLHYQLERRFSVGLGVGHGLVSGLGAPAWRGLFGLTITPSASEIVSLHPRMPHGDLDSDHDGIPDDLDKCPNEPEDRDMFDDGDGCPDPDNDNDGIPDAHDKCPLDAEDKDGFQDEDGCPDKDNDNDGIPDAQDKCPNEPEDKDGFEDLDGCPDPDNDGDGIPDALDKCPNEPETINGNQDEDGCPDKGDSLVILSPDRLELLEAITFNGTKLSRSASKVLAQVGATLRAHSELARVRITVHVQPTSNPDRDQEISDKRAGALREWLVNFGIPASRIELRGFGGTKPLVPADQRGSAAINDRVELIILERK